MTYGSRDLVFTVCSLADTFWRLGRGPGEANPRRLLLGTKLRRPFSIGWEEYRNNGERTHHRETRRALYDFQSLRGGKEERDHVER